MGESILIVDDDGSVRHWLCRLMNGLGYVAIGAASAEEALETLSLAPVDLVITDLKLPGMDGLALAKRLLAEDADRPVLMVTGYANLNNVREAMSVGIYEYFVKPFDTNDVMAGVRRALERHRLVLENRAYQRDLEQRVEARTAQLQAVNQRLGREVAEHRKDQEALIQERNRAQNYLDIAGVMMVAINADGRVTLINRKGCEVLGYEEAEVIGQNWFDHFLPGRNREEAQAVFKRLMAGEVKSVAYFENPVLARSGEERIIVWHNTVLKDEGGHIVGTFSSGEDITERRRVETELERQRVQVMQAERLRALGEMAAGIAHELNQPLNGIRTFAEGTIYGMKEGWEITEDELRETFSDIVTQVDRMTEIINHMRAFSRDSSEEDPVSFHTKTVVEDALKLVGAQLRVHGIQIHVDIPTHLPACKGWPHQIEQVLLNLISNARDAMDERAASIKRGDAASSPGWRPTLGIKVDYGAGENRLRIAVSDTGGGISENARPRVFDPFFTTKEVGKGTGLGLSISQNIVERHGGALRLQSRPGDGATFLILLPAEDA